ncbi:MAG: CBM96 family carbohydrate-binding protein [Candidatus Thorarchaeota archaeon]|jgi:hypothetical protein
MKRYSLIFLTILIIGLILPIMPNTTSNYVNDDIIVGPFENTPLAAIGETNFTVIKVSDDAPVFEGGPNTNYDDDTGSFGLDCSNVSGDVSRSWLKFNLKHLPNDLPFTTATVHIFTTGSVGSADYPRGIYFSENDTWTEETITWNNQPEYSAVPSAVIDSPASPDMFDVGFWYDWEITNEVAQTLEQDGTLSLVLSFVNENATGASSLEFSSREFGIVLGDLEYNIIPYISLEYAVPTTDELQVDGFSESPQIDYINSVNPDFSWTFIDADPDDSQKNHELEVWNNSAFDDSRLMQDNNSEITVVHDTVGAGTSSPDLFNSPFEIRFQFKWPSSLISQSGVVDRLFIEMDELSGTATYSDLVIYMVSVADSSALTTDFQLNYDGRTPIQVLNRSEFTAIIENGFMVFDIENTFIVNSGLNLIIELRHTGYSGTSTNSNYTGSGGGSIAFKPDGPSGAYYHTTADITAARTHGLKLELVGHEVFSAGASTNSIPFGLSVGDYGRFQFKYNQSLIDEEGVIDKILFPAGMVGDVVYENFSVYLVETPHAGKLSHTDMDSNYGGASSTLVLSADEYIIRDVGGVLVIDVDDIFFYSNTHNLMIELRFDSLVRGNQRALQTSGGGGYRAFASTPFTGNDTATYNMLLEFTYEPEPVAYTGSPLINATIYYWRVRTCDSMGIWSQWETSSFKYEVLTSLPAWSSHVETSSPIELGDSMTVSINATHITGIRMVRLEVDGTNHTMIVQGESYSYTWVPGSAGDISYTIFVESYSGTWATIFDSIGVEDTTSPVWISIPGDKVLDFGEALSYQLTASDLSGIASWSIDDTTNFEIANGLVTNKTALATGFYGLEVTVTDNEGNSLTGNFRVAVFDFESTTTPTSPTTSIQPTALEELGWVIAALVGVIVFLAIIILMQHRKT